MRFSTSLLFLSFAVCGLSQSNAAPQPKLGDISYWGSACPEGGLTASIGPVNETSNVAPFTFTLSNFLPALGSFGSSLRMCNIVSHVTVEKGWKVMVNGRGTYAQGNTNLPGNATMYLRGTYFFAEKAEDQSIGMVDVEGPLTGQFARHITPVDGDKGVAGPCTGGELDIEFQARAVENYMSRTSLLNAANETSWTLVTDLDILPC